MSEPTQPTSNSIVDHADSLQADLVLPKRSASRRRQISTNAAAQDASIQGGLENAQSVLDITESTTASDQEDALNDSVGSPLMSNATTLTRDNTSSIASSLQSAASRSTLHSSENDDDEVLPPLQRLTSDGLPMHRRTKSHDLTAVQHRILQLPCNKTLLLLLLFLSSAASLYALIHCMPPMTAVESTMFRFPRSLRDVRQMSLALSAYRAAHFWHVLCVFALTYIFMQTFAIPGAVGLSLLAGPLYGLPLGLLIVSLSATTGACLCYTVSRHLGTSLIQRVFPNMLARLRARLAKHESNLTYYLLFLRISPLLPNWFLSLASPIVGVPLRTFFVATLFGLVPAK